MATNIGPKISVDGEAEYKRQMQNIIQHSKTLDSEMKLLVSSFDESATAEEKAAAKNKILTEQINNQNERISLLADQLAKSTEATGENSTETLKLQETLNKAQTALNNMQHELDDSGSSMTEMTSDTEDLGESLEDSSDSALSFGDVLKANVISDAIVGGVKALGSAIADVSKSIAGAVKDSAGFADEILTLSTTTGLSTQELQEYQYMSELVDVSVSTITGSLTKLTKNMSAASGGTGAAAEAFEQLGISVTDSEGKLRSNQDVFDEAIDALSQMEAGTERDALAMTIFGKSAQDLNPLLAQGSEGLEAFRKEAHDVGYVLDNEALGALGAVDDSFQRTEKLVESMKNQIGVALAPAVEAGAEKFQKFAKFGIDAVGQLSQAFEDGGLDGMMDALGTVLSDGIAMITEQLPMYVEAGMQLLGSLSTGIIDNLPMLIEAALQIILMLAESIAESLPELVPTIVDVVIKIVETLISNVDMLVDASLAIIIALAEGIFSSMPELIAKAPEIVASLTGAIIRNVPKIVEAAVELVFMLANGIVDNFGTLIRTGSSMVETIKNGFWQKVEDANSWGRDLISNFISGITEKWNALKDKASGIASLIGDYIGFSEPKTGPLSRFHTFAPDMMDLFMSGIEQKTPELRAIVTESFDLTPYIRNGRPAGTQISRTYGNVNITVNAAEGQDEGEIARRVKQEIMNEWQSDEEVFA